MKIEWLQVVAAELNGIFRGFNMRISETLADGSQGINREYFIIQNNTLDIESNSTSISVGAIYNLTEDISNSTLAVEFDNTTRVFSLSFVHLRTYTNYSVSVAACTIPGCGNSSVISARTAESCKFVCFDLHYCIFSSGSPCLRKPNTSLLARCTLNVKFTSNSMLYPYSI